MFEDYRVEEVRPFQRKVQAVCLSDTGVLLALERNRLLISHVKGCLEPIELFHQLKKQLDFNYSRCNGIAELANYSSQRDSVCFAVIMQSDVWCLIVRMTQTQSSKIGLEIEQLKMLSMSQEPSKPALRFIDNERKNLLVLKEWVSQIELNLVEIRPQLHHIDKFVINRLNNIQFGRQNEPIEQQPSFSRKRLIFSVYLNTVFVYNQLPSEEGVPHLLFFYAVDSHSEAEGGQTFPVHILQLPEFQQSRLVAHVALVPTDQKMTIQQSIILSFYQLSAGLEIVQSDFTSSGAIKRRFLYPQIQFSQFLYSSITLKLIKLKGTEHCLINHSVLIRGTRAFTQNQLTLLALPSTGAPHIANQFTMQYYFNYLHSGQQGFWIFESLALKYVHRIGKSAIYQQFVGSLQKSLKRSLECLSGELQELLE